MPCSLALQFVNSDSFHCFQPLVGLLIIPQIIYINEKVRNRNVIGFKVNCSNLLFILNRHLRSYCMGTNI